VLTISFPSSTWSKHHAARDSLINMKAKHAHTGFTENYENQKNRSVFGTKFNFQNLVKDNKKQSGFFGLLIGF
jgi:hypothetical protein